MSQIDGVPLSEYLKNLLDFNVEFQPDSSEFRCCLGKVHILNAAKCFLLAELVFIVFYIFAIFPWWLFFIVFHLAVWAMTVYAIKKDKASVLWVQIAFSLLQIAPYIVLCGVLLIISLVDYQSFINFFHIGQIDSTVQKFSISFALKIILGLVLVFLYWKFTLFWTLREYFEAKATNEYDISDDADQPFWKKMLRPL